MKRCNVPSGSVLGPSIGFSRAVRVGSHIAVAGTAPIAPDGEGTVGKDAYQQTKRCLEIVAEAITAAGGALSDVTRTV
jgi:enamine deaminase RidA (YjgF/YER057c/UK114 family)